MGAIASEATHPSRSPGARTRVHPGPGRRMRTAPPASSGPMAGARPWG